MVEVLIFIVGSLVGFWVVWVWFSKKEKKEKASQGYKNKGLIEMQAEEKEEYKKRILDFMAGREKVSNNDIEKLIGVSDATATRYLEELEQEGEIWQVGKTGRFVYYEKI